MAKKSYFKASRDYWWNEDFLRLMANRWNLPPNPSILDVGAGQGHWGQALSRVLEPSRLTHLDVDIESLVFARGGVTSTSRHIAPAAEFVCASGDAIPFRDNTFDFVTCQTVLMHAADPTNVLREMVRVARLGARVVAVEPNDLANCAIVSPFFLDGDPSALLRHFEFWLAYGRGRRGLGVGDVSIGERLPTLFSQAGLANVSVHLSDKAHSVLAPYDSKEQQVRFDEEVSATIGAKDAWQRIWDDSELKACVSAGGGTEELFCAYAADVQKRLTHLSANLADRSFTQTGGRLLYIVSATKTDHPRVAIKAP